MPFDSAGFSQFRENQLGLTPFELAPRIGVTPQTIYNWERSHSQPSFKTLDILANVCHDLGKQMPSFYKPPF